MILKWTLFQFTAEARRYRRLRREYWREQNKAR